MPPAPTIEITPSHTARVGSSTVRRALPRRVRRTVGAWCFADHLGPEPVPAHHGADGPGGVGPHPHIGLQTVTWLLSGELLHLDSLGSEQTVRPGQLNLMTAGHGIAHAEELLTSAGGLQHGIQLWVAQPEATRHGPPAFEHHGELPQADLAHGTATVLVGTFAGVTSPARRDTDHLGAELALQPGSSTISLAATSEHALVVLEGRVVVDGARLPPGHLGYLDVGRDELTIQVDAPTRLMLLGGAPFESPISMWWNYVARSHDEIDAANSAWRDGDERFGTVTSALSRIPAPVPPWRS